ncbi:MAG: PEGA domain-containing protein [Bacteroidota bacterium]
MNAELGTQLRVTGLVRSPDHEGALAHLDVDRGFGLVARGAAALTDVIDPTVWVKEKLSVAVAGSSQGEPALKPLLAALRSLHAELVRRPQRDRPWVSVLAAVFQAGEGVIVSAGDCACFRYRDGLLACLKRPGTDAAGMTPPRGALGSEQQVRLDVVPLRPRPGDLYVASTRQLREGELAALARDLASARDGAELLRVGVEGASDRGRLVIRVLEADEDAAALPARAEAIRLAPVEDVADVEPAEPLDVAPLLEDHLLEELPGEPAELEGLGAPEFLRDSDAAPTGVPGAVIGDHAAATREMAGEPEAPAGETGERAGLESLGDLEPVRDASAAAGPAEANTSDAAPTEASEAVRRAPRTLAQIEDAPPWYEALALWVGGALAIIALALLVKAILPNILGTGAQRPAAVPAATKGVVDFFSDPSGAAVRVDGEWLQGKTPLAGVDLDAGTHRIELDWGPAGTWRDTVRVTAGERLAVHPAVYGAVALRSSDSGRALDVYLDGTFAGTTPLTLDHVVVGRHLVRFGGPDAAGTTQQVDVLRDAPVEVVGNAGPVPTVGKLTVRSALLTDAGFEPGKSEPIWIDGVLKGVTPLSVSLKPGEHSVRVVRRGFPAQVTVLDVKPGGDHYVTAEFGSRSEEPLQLSPPEGISLSSPLPITVTIPEGAWDPSVAVWLYAAAPEGAFQAKRMTKLEGGDRVFATVVPPEVARNSARRVRVYCKAAGSDGRELFTEILTLPVTP